MGGGSHMLFLTLKGPIGNIVRLVDESGGSSVSVCMTVCVSMLCANSWLCSVHCLGCIVFNFESAQAAIRP